MQERVARCRSELSDALRLLGQMVSMESPSFDKGLMDKFAAFVADRFHRDFHETGAKVDIIPAQKFGNHLRIQFPASPDKRILLLGHMDTVWPAGEITKRAFAVESDQAVGP